MHRTWLPAACAALLLGLSAGPLQAQYGRYDSDSALGLRAGYEFNADAFAVGIQTRSYGPPISLSPSFDVYFLNGRRAWQINLDALFSYDPLAVFAGAGIAVGNRNPLDSVTRTDWSLFAGLHFPMRIRIRPFAEARWTFLGNGQPFQLMGGLELTAR
ncbi:MAG TPA: hypothetical protein VJ957_06155 [Longimicrobiales bacterium]|nr:hypothetical protein [Longimicrobiales bacterium]